MYNITSFTYYFSTPLLTGLQILQKILQKEKYNHPLHYHLQHLYIPLFFSLGHYFSFHIKFHLKLILPWQKVFCKLPRFLLYLLRKNNHFYQLNLFV